MTKTIAPKGIEARTGKGAKGVSKTKLRQSLNPSGNTVLKDFGRILRDEPHKYIYPIRLYMVKDKVALKPVMEWLRDRYINARGGVHHGSRYEVRSYNGGKQRYVDYILLERMTDDELTEFTLMFGDVTDKKVERDGKMRRIRLKKEEREVLDRMIDDYYLKVEQDRIAEANAA